MKIEDLSDQAQAELGIVRSALTHVTTLIEQGYNPHFFDNVPMFQFEFHLAKGIPGSETYSEVRLTVPYRHTFVVFGKNSEAAKRYMELSLKQKEVVSEKVWLLKNALDDMVEGKDGGDNGEESKQ